MNWHGPMTALLLGAILGLALWTPTLPWLLKSLGVADLVQSFLQMLAQTDIPPPMPRSRSFVAPMTSNAIDELGELASDLTSALQNLQEYLKAEGERVQREIVDYAHLNRTALTAIKTIIDTPALPRMDKMVMTS
jgi:hypothetical protein